MKVKLKGGRVGNRFAQGPGDVIEVEEAEGGRMVDAGLADRVPEAEGVSLSNVGMKPGKPARQ